MPKLSILFGVILMIIGGAGYGFAAMSGKASITALIPAFFGIPMALFGLVAEAKESLRKHLMHASVVVALLGFIAMSAELYRRMDSLSMSPAAISMIATAVVCLIFVILGIRSFANARASRAE
jgi:amino acid transporter